MVGVERVVSVGYNRLYRVICGLSFKNVFVRMGSIDFPPCACPRLSLCLLLLYFLPWTGQHVAGIDCLRVSRQVR